MVCLWLLLTYFSSVASTTKVRHTCIATLGGTHLGVYQSIVKEIIARGHNVTVFSPDGYKADTPKVIGEPTSLLRYMYYQGATPEPPDAAMKLFWSSTKATDTLLGSFSRYVIIRSYVTKFREAVLKSPELLHQLSTCDVVFADAFQWFITDIATKLNIPSIFCLNLAFAPPPFVLFPLSAPPPYAHPVQSTWTKQLATDVADLLAPFVDAFSAHINGWLFYGYPRHIFATMFSRPFIFTSSAAQSWGGPLPRNIIPLGPLNAELAVAPRVNSRVNDGKPLDIAAFVPNCREVRPLLVAPKKLLFAAFGTRVRIPVESARKLCAAFKIVLDSGKVDAVLFSRRVLGDRTEDADKFKTTCQVPSEQLPECDDPRIWSTSWVRQKEIFDSGATALFMSHGGFNSLLEVASAQVPVAVMPLFGDQPDNADILHHSGAAVELMKADTAEDIASGLLKVLNNPQQFLDSMRDFVNVGAITSGLLSSKSSKFNSSPRIVSSVAGKGADLIELAADGGTNNILQRLVPYQWAELATPEGPSATSPIVIGAVVVLAVTIMGPLITLWILFRVLRFFLKMLGLNSATVQKFDSKPTSKLE